MDVGTFNARTLRTEDRVLQLEEELRYTNWNIIGLSKIKRTGEDLINLRSGNVFYFVNKSNTSEGVGFLVNKKWARQTMATVAISARVAYMVVNITQRYQLKLIQVYAPTTTHTNEEVEEMYDKVARAMEENRTHFQIVCEDFNAKVGERRKGETCLGTHWVEDGNERGQMLLIFLEKKQHKLMNSFH